MGPLAVDLSLKLVASEAALNRHHSDFLFHFSRVDHGDGVPRTSIQEAAVGPFADALLASDAENRVDLIRPNGGLSSSGTQNMQSSTGQYSTHAGEPAHPVQHSVITASSLGFFLRGVASPLDFGSNLSSSGTIPTARVAPDAAGMRVDYTSIGSWLLAFGYWP